MTRALEMKTAERATQSVFEILFYFFLKKQACLAIRINMFSKENFADHSV